MNGSTALRSLRSITRRQLSGRAQVLSQPGSFTKRSITIPSHTLRPARPSALHNPHSCRSQVPSYQQGCSRELSTSAPRLAGPATDSAPALSMTTEEYEKVSERDMDLLHENLEILCEEFGQGDWEVEYSSGVMNLSIPPHGTYVINKQPPNQQIWISSPVSGPSRFDYIQSPKSESETNSDIDSADQGAWTHHRRSDVKLGKLLDSELREILASYGDEGQAWTGTGLA